MRFRHKAVEEMPTVPEDVDVRKAALQESLTRMNEATKNQKKVDRQAKRFNKALDENHFIQKLEAAYGTKQL